MKYGHLDSFEGAQLTVAMTGSWELNLLALPGWLPWRGICMISWCLKRRTETKLALAAGQPSSQCSQLSSHSCDRTSMCVCVCVFVLTYIGIYIPGIKPRIIQIPGSEVKKCWLSFLLFHLYICNLDIYLFSSINILLGRSMCCSVGQERDDSSDLHAISLVLAY